MEGIETPNAVLSDTHVGDRVQSGLDQVIDHYIETSSASDSCRYPSDSKHQVKKYISTYLEVILRESYSITKLANPTTSEPEVAPGFVEDAARRCNEPKIVPPYDGFIKWGGNIGNALIGVLISQSIVTITSPTITKKDVIILVVIGLAIAAAHSIPKYLHRRSLKIIAPK